MRTDRLARILAAVLAVACISLPAGRERAIAEAPVSLGHGVNIELWNKEAGSPEHRIDLAKSIGFTFVRMGVPINLWLEDGSQEGRRRALDILQRAVTQARASGIRPLVVLFIKGRKEGLSAGQMICGTDDEERRRYMAGLQEVLALLPDDENTVFEPLNEPPGGCSPQGTGTASGTAWANMQLGIYRTVRQLKPHIIIVIDGGHFGDLDGLLEFDPSPYVADRRTVMSFHYYEPKLFTHQGLADTTGMGRKHPAWVFAQHVPWPYDDSGVAQSRSDTLHTLEGSSVPDSGRARDDVSREFSDYRNSGSERHLEERFNAAADWASRYHIEPERVLVGEVGVARANHDTTGTPTPGADRYLSEVRQTAERHHFPWAIWDLDGGFAIVCGTPPHEELCPLYRSVLAAP